MILSNVSTYSVEEVEKTLGMPPWQQLYMPVKWDDTEKMVKRIEDAGCPVLVWTVDLLAGRNTPTMARFARQDTRNCVACHTVGGRVTMVSKSDLFPVRCTMDCEATSIPPTRPGRPSIA